MTEPGGTGRRVFLAGLSGITLLAAALRLEGLSTRELWLDESCTSFWVHHFNAGPEESASPWHEPAHVPYFFLLRIWTRLFGENEWGLRSLSAVSGTLTVAILGLLAARLSQPRVGILVALLAAIHPLHLYYSQEARAYAFWVFLVSVLVYLLVRAAQEGRFTFWAGYVGLSLLAFLTHYYTLFWIPATLAALLLSPALKMFFRSWMKAHAILGLLIIPPAWFWMRLYMQTGPAGWQREIWNGYPPWLAIPRSLWALLPSGGYPRTYLAPLDQAAGFIAEVTGKWSEVTVRWLPAGIVVVMLAVLMLKASRNQAPPTRGQSRDWGHAPTCTLPACLLFLAAIGLGYLTLIWLGSAILGRGYLVGRYDLAAWPSLLIALVVLVDRVCATTSRNRGATLAIVLMLAICSLMTWVGYRREPVIHATHERARRIAERVSPDDLVVSVGMYRWFMDHEWRTLGFSPELRSFPSQHDRQLCWRDVERERQDSQEIKRDMDRLLASMTEALNNGRQVWVLWLADPTDKNWQVDGLLLERLRQSRFDFVPVDEWAGLIRITAGKTQAVGAG